MLSAITSYLWGEEENVNIENEVNVIDTDCAGDQPGASKNEKESEWIDEWIFVEENGKGTKPLRASSLENLLMEHPSMSVYQRSSKGRRHPIPVRAMLARRKRKDVKKELKSESYADGDDQQQNQQQLHPARPIHANHQLVFNSTPVAVARRVERERQQKHKWSKSKSVMNRCNHVKGGANPPKHMRTRYNQPCGKNSRRC